MDEPVRLQLFAGPGVALPVPKEVLDAVKEVEVETASGDTQSGFQITFSLPNRSPLHTLFLISSGANIPILRVVIALTVRGVTTVLMDGVMTHHEVRSEGGPTSTLVVKGKDLTALMDVIPFNGLPYPAMSPSLRVLAGVSKYAALGVVPLVIPAVLEDFPIPIDEIPRHQGTDCAYFKYLARKAGYVFYIDPGPVPGVSKAYWGPELRIGVPQPALNVSLDGPHDNVKSLSFRVDKEKKELPVVYVQERASKVPVPIPIPDVTPLNPPLGLVPPLPPKIKYLEDTAKLNPLQAALTGLAYASQHSDAVFGEGSLDVARYGSVLRARGLVGVRGAGDALDGLYYVSSVTSTMKRGEFTQSFALARNGLLSTIPKVPV